MTSILEGQAMSSKETMQASNSPQAIAKDLHNEETENSTHVGQNTTDTKQDAQDSTRAVKDTTEGTNKQDADLTSTVAKHYNSLQELGREERTRSRIFYMRNFNNWIKSVLINDFITRLKTQQSREGSRGPGLTVLDLCSGKGGDLLKWQKANIRHLVCADIAETSVQQCEERYKDMRSRRNPCRFSAQFIAADCTKARLRDIYENPHTTFDLTSCQFSFHYSFESLAQAHGMIRNACESLRPGGYFIGTTADSYELVKRARAAEDGRSFGNEVYSVKFQAEDTHALPLFGAKYDFHLEGVVDCPEFLVLFPAFVKLAEQYGMRLVYRKPFAEFFTEQVKGHEARQLLNRMQALETYPAEEGVELVSSEKDSYSTARDHVTTAQDAEHGRHSNVRVGTLSQDEWEALTIYTTFAFQKVGEEAAGTQDASSSSTPRDPHVTPRKRKHRDSPLEEGQIGTSRDPHVTPRDPHVTPRKREHRDSPLEEGQIGTSEGSGEEGPPGEKRTKT